MHMNMIGNICQDTCDSPKIRTTDMIHVYL